VTPDDLDGRKVPLFIGCAEKDEMVSPTLVQDLRVGLEREDNDFEIKIYEDMKHGFAARPNHEDSKVRIQCDVAFDDAIAFLTSKL
jgi:dienelactone hydrolase